MILDLSGIHPPTNTPDSIQQVRMGALIEENPFAAMALQGLEFRDNVDAYVVGYALLAVAYQLMVKHD